MNIKNTAILSLAVAVLSLALGGCADKPTLTEQTFGDSVRHIVRAQTYDASTLETPSTDVPGGTDGQLMENVIDAYRTTVGQPAQVGNDIVINVGGGQR